MCLLNSLHLERVDIRINFPVFRVWFFCQNLSYTHLFLWYKGRPIEDHKSLGDNGWYSLLPHILLLRDSLSFYIIFFLLYFPRLLKWPLRWERDVTSFMDVQPFSSFLAGGVFKLKIIYFKIYFKTFPIFSFRFQLFPSLSVNDFS